MLKHSFGAMGTAVECLVEAEPSPESAVALWTAEAEFHRLEAILSRFRGDSELSELNRQGSLVAGPDLVRVVQLALVARERTGGRFDPTVHDALVAAGYDRTFEELERDGAAAVGEPPRCGGRVVVDPRTGLVELEPGTRLDVGGIAKGDAVDRACDILGDAGPCLVNAGGDLAVHGRPREGVWPVGVETASGTITLGLGRGAIATSGCDRRRWRRGGVDLHHVIDPSTGRSVDNELLRATVVAETAVEAEVLATSFFLAGERRAIEEADKLGIPCLFVTRDGRGVTAGGLA